MNPISLAQAIPARARAAIYSILVSLFAIELVLDASGYGLIPADAQEVVVGILGVLGFGLARSNTSTIVVTEE